MDTSLWSETSAKAQITTPTPNDPRAHHSPILHLLLCLVIAGTAFFGYRQTIAYPCRLGPYPDADEYAISAYNLAHEGRFGFYSGDGGFWVPRYTMGFSLLLAPFTLGCTGIAGVFSGILVYVSLSGLACYWTLYRLGRNPWIAVAASLCLLASPLSRSNGRYVLSEHATLTLFLIYVSLFATFDLSRSSRLHIFALAAAWSAMVWVRPIMAIWALAPVIVSIPVLLSRNRPQDWLTRIGAAFLGASLVIPLLAFNAQHFGSPFRWAYQFWTPFWYDVRGNTYALRYLLHGNRWHDTGTVALYWQQMLQGSYVGWPVLVPLGLVGLVWRTLDGQRHRRTLTLALSGILYVGIFLLYFYTNLRFFIFFIPFIFWGLFTLVEKLAGLLGRKSRGASAFLVLAAIGALAIPSDSFFRESWERIVQGVTNPPRMGGSIQTVADPFLQGERVFLISDRVSMEAAVHYLQEIRGLGDVRFTTATWYAARTAWSILETAPAGGKIDPIGPLWERAWADKLRIKPDLAAVREAMLAEGATDMPIPNLTTAAGWRQIADAIRGGYAVYLDQDARANVVERSELWEPLGIHLGEQSDNWIALELGE